MASIAKYNGVSAYKLKPLGIDTREMNGVYTPNQIVQTNLNYSYDFANPESYPGSGTTVTSLVNAYTGTVNGSPTFNSTTGAFNMDGVNDYIALAGWTRPVNWSLGFWFTNTDWSTPAAFTQTTVFHSRQSTPTNATNGFRINLVRQADGVKYIRIRWLDLVNQNTDIINTTVGNDYFTSNQWYYLCWSRTNSTNITVWMSNPSTGLLTEVLNFTPNGGANQVTMSSTAYGCNDAASTFHDGKLGELHEYSTNLSLTNFQQNFNNTKARYGY